MRWRECYPAADRDGGGVHYLRLLPSRRARVPSRAISVKALASTKVSLLSWLKLASCPGLGMAFSHEPLGSGLSEIQLGSVPSAP